MNNLTRFRTTSAPATRWVESPICSPTVSSSTSTNQSHVVMVQVRPVAGRDGFIELAASIDPASLRRKLAVMRVSAELDGKVVTSTAA